MCVVALQTNVPPPPQVPFAPAGPQPLQTLPTVSELGSVQVSPEPQEPGTVRQPVAGEQAAVQQTLAGPTEHVVAVGRQVQATQLPTPSQWFVHSAA